MGGIGNQIGKRCAFKIFKGRYIGWRLLESHRPRWDNFINRY